MAVIPVRAALLDVKAIREGLAGRMPLKLRPGTPSMPEGSSMPCQWIELVDGQAVA